MSDSLIEKVVTTDVVADGNPVGTGGLTYAQADRFIDYMWDETVLGALVRTRRMRAVEEEIDTIAVGARLVRGATEAVDTGENAGPTFGKLSITTKKFRLDWELSSESLEDNIEGADLEDHIARLMATQLGNDLEDIAINGDTSSSVPGIDVIDGWRKRAVAGAHVVDNGGDALTRATFN
jgi:HK97 family phage major capsid protein